MAAFVDRCNCAGSGCDQDLHRTRSWKAGGVFSRSLYLIGRWGFGSVRTQAAAQPTGRCSSEKVAGAEFQFEEIAEVHRSDGAGGIRDGAGAFRHGGAGGHDAGRLAKDPATSYANRR